MERTADELDAAWEGTLTVLKSSRGMGRDDNDRVFYIGYSPNDANPAGAVCNRLHGAGSICRLPRNHVEEYGIPHMEFDPNLVVTSGIYVDAIGPDPSKETPDV